jgi:hypothetical protein
LHAFAVVVEVVVVEVVTAVDVVPDPAVAVAEEVADVTDPVVADVELEDIDADPVDTDEVLSVVVVVVLPGHAGNVVSWHKPLTTLQCDSGQAPAG